MYFMLWLWFVKIFINFFCSGMEERISSLEAELERNKNCSPTTTQSNTTTNNNNNNSSSSKQEDETSSDGGIESGTEVDGEIV